MQENTEKKDISYYKNYSRMRYRDILFLFSHEIDFLQDNSKFNESVENRTKNENKWSSAELNVLYDGILKYGKGNWIQIYTANQEFFDKKSRTPEDLEKQFQKLKDNKKWANI